MARFLKGSVPANKLTQEDFLDRCEKEHGDYYDYSKAVYKTSKEKVAIICPIHGEFYQAASKHMNGGNCPKCAVDRNSDLQRLKHFYTAEDFITQAKEVHGDRYDYSKVIIESTHTPIIVTCLEHGDFETYVNVHLKGHHCRKCANNARVGKGRKTQSDFLARCNEVHGDRYDYSKSVYVKNMEKVEIICRKHGSFWTTPTNHYRGKGCKKCADEKLSEDRRMSEALVWQKCKETHGNKYDYLGFVTDYTNNTSKIRILCKDHGEFQQAVSPHILGSGCPVCGTLNSRMNRKDYCKRHPNSNMYLLEIKNAEEHYLKVGISIDPYFRVSYIKKEIVASEIKILSAIPLESEMAWNLESAIHRSKFLVKYSPREWFGGGTECYSLEEKARFCEIFNRLEDKFGGYNGEEFRPSAD